MGGCVFVFLLYISNIIEEFTGVFILWLKNVVTRISCPDLYENSSWNLLALTGGAGEGELKIFGAVKNSGI